jgi:hypothetical protein
MSIDPDNVPRYDKKINLKHFFPRDFDISTYARQKPLHIFKKNVNDVRRHIASGDQGFFPNARGAESNALRKSRGLVKVSPNDLGIGHRIIYVEIEGPTLNATVVGKGVGTLMLMNDTTGNNFEIVNRYSGRDYILYRYPEQALLRQENREASLARAPFSPSKRHRVNRGGTRLLRKSRKSRRKSK